MEWWSSGRTRAVRIALEMLFMSGAIVVHHRVGNRRYFELSRRVLPARLSRARKSRSSRHDYLDWHVLRRSGGVGLVDPKVNAKWGGIIGWRGGRIRAALTRLVNKGRLARVAIEGVPRKECYVRRGDLAALEAAGTRSKAPAGAAFIAPLDNLMWDGDLIETLFDFVYVWEVYKPASTRKWGYYVLPVLVGDRFVARVDKNDEDLLAALQDCLRQFCRYLGADSVKLGERPKRDPLLKAMARAV